MAHINTKCQNITINLFLDFELIDFYFYFKQEIGTSYFHGNLGSPPVYTGVFSVFYVVFFVIFLCTQCCQCLWIVHSGLSLRFSLTFIFQIFKFYSWFNVNSQYNLLLTKLLKVTDKCCYTYIRPMLSYHQHLDAWFPRVQ